MNGEIWDSTLFSDANCQAVWRLEDANDSKNSYNWTNNGPGAFSAAKFNNGFDEGNSNTTKYLSQASAIGLLWMGNKTFGGWVKMNDEIGSGSQVLFNVETPDGNRGLSYLLYDYNGGTRRIKFGRFNDAVTTPVNDGAFYTVTLGTTLYHHIVFTYNGTTIKGWVDGASATQASGDSGSQSTYSTAAAVLGSDLAGASKTSAIYDDWAVFNRVLSDAEIGNWYNKTLTTRFASSGMMNFFLS